MIIFIIDHFLEDWITSVSSHRSPVKQTEKFYPSTRGFSFANFFPQSILHCHFRTKEFIVEAIPRRPTNCLSVSKPNKTVHASGIKIGSINPNWIDMVRNSCQFALYFFGMLFGQPFSWFCTKKLVKKEKDLHMSSTIFSMQESKSKWIANWYFWTFFINRWNTDSLSWFQSWLISMNMIITP